MFLIFCRFERAQDDLIAVVKQQEQRHLESSIVNQDEPDLCDELRKQMEESELREVNEEKKFH